MDSAIETVLQDQSRATHHHVLNVTLLARLALNIQANVPLANPAVEIFSTSNVLTSVQLVPMQLMELANIVPTIARAALDLTLLAQLVPLEKFYTMELAMINVHTS